MRKKTPKKVELTPDKKYRVGTLVTTSKYIGFSDILKSCFDADQYITLAQADRAIQNYLNHVEQ